MSQLIKPMRMWSAHGCMIPNYVLRNKDLKLAEKMLYGYTVAFCDPGNGHVIELDVSDAAASIGIDVGKAIKSLYSLQKKGFFNKIIQDDISNEYHFSVDCRVNVVLIEEYEALGVHVVDRELL